MSQALKGTQCSPADPGSRNAMNGKQSELQVLRGARGFFPVPPVLHVLFHRAARSSWTERPQVEPDELIHSICESG